MLGIQHGVLIEFPSKLRPVRSSKEGKKKSVFLPHNNLNHILLIKKGDIRRYSTSHKIADTSMKHNFLSPSLRMPRWLSVSSRLISQQKSASLSLNPSRAFSSPRSAGMTMYPKARKKILCESGWLVSHYKVLLVIGAISSIFICTTLCYLLARM